MIATISQELAVWASTLTWPAVPAPVRDAVTLRLADVVGLVAAARGTAPGRAVLEVARRAPGPAPLLFEDTRVAPAAAALAHGTLAHTLDFDDTDPDSVVHPSSVVIPAALAVAHEAPDVTDVLAAAAAGYEFLARVGGAAGRGFHARGFQASGVLGPLAAALVVGRARGEDPGVVVSAMGLAGSMSGGLLEFLSDGTWSKRLHPGWAAHAGLTAVDLAAAGFSGPAAVLEGRHGVFRSFLGRDVGHDEVVAGLGARWPSQRVEPKFYPCAHVIHPFLDLALHLQHEHGLEVHDIDGVVCHVAPWHVPIVCEPRAEKIAPVGEYQARASLPYAVAVALQDRRVDVRAFEDAAVSRPEILRLAARIVHEPDEALTGGFGARLTIRTRSGRTVTAAPEDLPAPAPVAEQVRAKFDDAIGALLPDGTRDGLWDAAIGVAAAGSRALFAAARQVPDAPR